MFGMFPKALQSHSSIRTSFIPTHQMLWCHVRFLSTVALLLDFCHENSVTVLHCVCLWGALVVVSAYTFYDRIAWALLHVVKMEFVFRIWFCCVLVFDLRFVCLWFTVVLNIHEAQRASVAHRCRCPSAVPAHVVLITAPWWQGTTLQGNSQTGWSRPFGSSDPSTCLTAAFP